MQTLFFGLSSSEDAIAWFTPDELDRSWGNRKQIPYGESIGIVDGKLLPILPSRENEEKTRRLIILGALLLTALTFCSLLIVQARYVGLILGFPGVGMTTNA